MNTNMMLKRHPMTAIACALITTIATGCTSERDDDRRFTDANMPAASIRYGAATGSAGSSGSMQQPMQPGPTSAAQGPSPQQQQPHQQQLMEWERRDMGVTATRTLHDGQMHGPTPNQIPGGQVITTVGLTALLQQNAGAQMIDVLGAEATLPQAIPAVFASAPGSYDDRTQQQVARFLANVTRNDPNVPLVFFCGGPECWMSYNAALRAIALGYRNVLWYRGGLEAWNHAQLPFSRRAAQATMGNGNDRG